MTEDGRWTLPEEEEEAVTQPCYRMTYGCIVPRHQHLFCPFSFISRSKSSLLTLNCLADEYDFMGAEAKGFQPECAL
jgi:hypothetical protein